MINKTSLDLFQIVHMEQLKEQQDVMDYTTVDFAVGYDDYVYILMSENPPERINGMFVDTQAYTHYIALVLSVDWIAGVLLNVAKYDLGSLNFNYHYIRPFGDDLLLMGARCEYFSESNIEKNGLIIDKAGRVKKMLCFGDGIQGCITTPDKRIITSYFDEGIFGNYGWDEPIGAPGLLVWNDCGEIIWENSKYDICDCYAMNMDSSNRLWFYYYTDFDLVCTDFKSDMVMHPNIGGCYAFAISESRSEVLFSNSYLDHSFRLFTINKEQQELCNREEVSMRYNQLEVEPKRYHFYGAKLLFMLDNGELCGYHMNK